jgi:hypothetical protein
MTQMIVAFLGTTAWVGGVLVIVVMARDGHLPVAGARRRRGPAVTAAPPVLPGAVRDD